MTTTTPRPMPTPDLAGLLARPARRPPAPPAATAKTEGEKKEQAEDSAHASPIGTDLTVPAEPPQVAEGQRPELPITPDAVSSRPKAARRPVQPASAAAPPPRQYRRSITVLLPRSLHRQLGTAATERGTTRTALMLTAVNTTHRALGATVGSAPASGRSSDLFEVPQERTPAEPNVETTIRVTDQQLRALDDLATEHGMKRSQVIAEAIRLYLA